MIRVLGRVALLVLSIPVLLFLGYWTYAQFVQSPRFAAEFFTDLVEIERVEASRRFLWGSHPWAGSTFGCTFAIATLTERASTEPPSSRNVRSYRSAWPSEWHATPLETQDGHHAILEECAYALPADLVVRLRAASDEPGSFQNVGSEKLFLYAPNHRLIAMIRFGD